MNIYQVTVTLTVKADREKDAAAGMAVAVEALIGGDILNATVSTVQEVGWNEAEPPAADLQPFHFPATPAPLKPGECGRCGSMPEARDITCPECSPGAPHPFWEPTP